MTALVTVGETPLRLSPPGASRLETATEADICADGTESNLAVAAGTLGVGTTWLSKLPDTPPGRRIVTQLRQYGVDTAVTWTEPGAGRVGVTFRESGPTPRTCPTSEPGGRLQATVWP